MTPTARLRARDVTLAYRSDAPVVEGLSLELLDGKVTSIIGPNGCGKSTLLRALARLLRPRAGAVVLDGQAIHSLATKDVARQLGLLSQQAAPPDLVTVEDLVRRGRYPHQRLFQPPTGGDQAAVDRALALTGVEELRNRAVDELSGGQRQRAWIAMTLAQETPILLLDEPTTFLDVAHQQAVLALFRHLCSEEGRTVVLVLHDVNDAASVSDRIVALRAGRIAAQGSPTEVVTPAVLERVFGVTCDVVTHPASGIPVSIPRGAGTLPPAMPAGPPSRDLSVQPKDAPFGEPAPAVRIDGLSSGYGPRTVLSDVALTLPRERVTAIVGPNACGKSTLLKTLARLLPLQTGRVELFDQPLERQDRRGFARTLGMLAQGPATPPGLLAEDLIATGRYPYQRWYRQWSAADERAVEAAVAATDVGELRLRAVDELSGGQRQRVWLALALAQETPLLLLDEPTTFLDIAHQVEVLDLVRELVDGHGRTVVMVLHDLGQACRYADHLVVMHSGRVVAAGDPRAIVVEALVEEVFGIANRIVPDPLTGKPLILPITSSSAARHPPRLAARTEAGVEPG